MSALSYKQVLRESGHLTLTWRGQNRTINFFEKLAQLDLCSTRDTFLVRSDDSARKQAKVVTTGTTLIEDGILKINQIGESGLSMFERAKWIFCARLENKKQIIELFENSIDEYLVSNFVPPSQLVKKLIRNFSKSDPNCFVIFDPAWPSKFTIVGDDALFDFVVANAKENIMFQAERGELTHCRKTRKNLFPDRLRAEDRIEAINPSTRSSKPKTSIPVVEAQTPLNSADPKKTRAHYFAGPLIGSNWFTDSADVAHLTFFSAPEIISKTQELKQHLETVESSDGVDGEKLIAIGNFLGSADRIALMLTGPHTGAVVIFFHEVDDQIIAPNLEHFTAQLNSKDMSLLKRFGVTKFNRDGKLVAPQKL